MSKRKNTNDFQEELIAAIQKQFGKEGIGVLGAGGKSEVGEVLSTSIDAIDHYLLGCGGLPVGRTIEVYSEEGAGKTSFTWGCIKGALSKNAIVCLCETESALNLERAKVFGVDLKRVILIEPEHMEDAIAKIAFTLERLPGNVPALLVWDSVASCPPRAEIEEGLQGKDLWDTRAKLMSKACRVFSKLAVDKRACMLFVNQVREKMGVMFGDKYTTPCGKALKFHASIRLQLFPGKSIKNTRDEHVGKIITFISTKNRLASPYRKVKVRLDFAKGWNNDWTTLNHSKELDFTNSAKLKGLKGDQLKTVIAELKQKLDDCDWCLPEEIENEETKDDASVETVDEATRSE